MSAKRLSCGIGCVMAAFLAIQTGIVLATTITVAASADVWIREKNADSTYEDDEVLLAKTGDVDSGKQRRGAVEFDLGSVAGTITGAHLDLYDYVYIGTTSNDQALSQTAFSSPKHGALTSLTWNNMGTYTAGGVDFETFGVISLPGGQTMGQYYSSSPASTADVALLESLRESAEKKLTVLLIPTSGANGWGDIYNGHPAQLVLTTTPEPSTLILSAICLIGLLAYAWRKHK